MASGGNDNSYNEQVSVYDDDDDDNANESDNEGDFQFT